MFFRCEGLPREAFKGITRFAFTWAVPLLLIANVPARTLFTALDGRDLISMGLATAILLTLSTLIFQAAYADYGSASS